MRIKRTATWLFACSLLVLLASVAKAQPGTANLNYQSGWPSYSNASAPWSNDVPSKHRAATMPYGPQDVEPHLQPFAPADTTGYGNGVRPKLGWYGSYERLFWSLSKPEFALIGSPNPHIAFNGNPITSLIDNSFIEAIGAWGNRWEIGYIDADASGWQVSVLDHISQAQFLQYDDVAGIAFDDPDFLLDGFIRVPIPDTDPQQFEVVDAGYLPTLFTTLAMKNQLTLNGVELMREFRAPRLHNGAYFEVLYGVRWFQIDDTFVVNATGSNPAIVAITPTGPSGGSATGTFNPANPLADSLWSTRARNELVGPEIGGRWSHRRQHWVTTLEARFMAAANFQNLSQITELGTLQPNIGGQALFNFLGSSSRTHLYDTKFSPLGELRLNATYMVTSSVGLTVGYTGMIVGNVARASNRIDYQGPNLVSIKTGNSYENFFLNGLSFGVVCNR